MNVCYSARLVVIARVQELFMRWNSISVLLALAFQPGAEAPLRAQPLDANTPEIASKTLPTSKLVRIPAKGQTFTAGSPRGEQGVIANETEHEVTLSADFYLGVTPVTRGQFAAFVQDTGYRTKPEKDGTGGGWDDEKKDWDAGQYNWRNPGFSQTDEHPAVKVGWHDAVAFCRWLSEKDGRDYRLPTEAQWEFACRAGSRTRFSFGDDGREIAKYGNVADAKFREVTTKPWGIKDSDGYAFTSPVGLYQKNALGLYDMHGNVQQWCSDAYADYPASSVADPQGPPGKENSHRVLRGGCWRNDPEYGRSASRHGGPPMEGGVTVGFRVAVPAP
jgi:formylglycine-generating enzyme